MSKKAWDEAIKGFYEKYSGFTKWHQDLVREVVKNRGLLALPEGPRFWFQKVKKGDYNRAQIYNYPIQGLSAEILNIVLCQVRSFIRKYGLKALLVNTVHDSIIVDAPQNEVDTIVELWYNVYRRLSESVSKFFNIHVDVPLAGELKVGANWLDMQTVHS